MKKQQILTDARLRSLVAFASIVVIVAGLRAVSTLLDYLLLAAILALAAEPLLAWLIRKGMSRTLAIVTVTAATLVGGLAAASLFGAALAQLIQDLPAYGSRFNELVASAREFLAGHGIDAKAIMGAGPDPGTLVSAATTILGRISSLVGASLLILIIAAIMLVETPQITDEIQSRFEAGTILFPRLVRASISVRRYLSIIGIVNLLIAAGSFVVLLAFGVPYAVVWAVLSFFLSFVPSLGFVLYALPPAALTLLAYGGTRALWVLAALFVVNIVIDNVVKPRFMQQGLNISFLLIVVSFLFWGYVFGAVGFILAVPLTMVFRGLLFEQEPEETAAE